MSVSGVDLAPPAPGDYHIYRQITRIPAVALVSSIVKGPIKNSPFGFVKTYEDAKDEWLDLIKNTFLPLHDDIMRDALRAIDYGWSPFEPVYVRKRMPAMGGGKKYLTLAKLKPLLPAITQPILDSGGNVIGLLNKPEGQKEVRLMNEKQWVFTYDSEYGDPFGNGHAEACRPAFTTYTETFNKLRKFFAKTSASNTKILYPDGTSKDVSGADRPNAWIAKWLADTVARGDTVCIPNLYAVGAENAALAANLAGKSQWMVEHMEGVNCDFAKSMLEGLYYLDKCFFRAYLRPERVGLETNRGGRADAKAHTDTGTTDCTVILNDITRGLTEGPCDALLVANFGEEARGAIRVSAAPVEDDTADTYKTIAEAMLKVPQVAMALTKYINLPAMFDELNVPLNDNREELEGGIDPETLLPFQPPQVQNNGLVFPKTGSDDDGDDGDGGGTRTSVLVRPKGTTKPTRNGKH